jgi:uncharacterized protein (UPF0297 family)
MNLPLIDISLNAFIYSYYVSGNSNFIPNYKNLSKYILSFKAYECVLEVVTYFVLPEYFEKIS